VKILVGAGPTREMIDSVRFLSNLSSGRTGIDIARAAQSRGHAVTLVLGPTHLSPPDGIDTHRVGSAIEMRDALIDCLPHQDAFLMCAAVADYRPALRHAGKLKKDDGPLSLELVRNPDILAEAGQLKGRRVHIGFALEVQDAESNARAKLERKNLDALVLNGPENLGAAQSRFRVLKPEGFGPELCLSKAALGEHLVKLAEELYSESQA
jgi:phosphopantothenoylcysteine decarboxylase / phosphopantothenate---cysteine ligase